VLTYAIELSPVGFRNATWPNAIGARKKAATVLRRMQHVGDCLMGTPSRQFSAV
jgi:hypothetical protein